MTNLVRLTLPSMSASATAPIEVLRLPAGVHGSELVRDALTDILNGVTGPAVAFVADGDERAADTLAPDIALEDPRTSLILMTSGSTADPKGVCIGTENLLSAAIAVEQRHADVKNAPRILALPVTSAAGCGVIVRALVSQMPLVTLPSIGGAQRFTPALFAETVTPWIDQAPLVSLVPTQLHALLADPVTRGIMPKLGRVFLGGAQAPDALLADAYAAGVDVCLTYGMTETCGGCVHDGVALPGVEAGLDNDGIILLNGPMIALGYRRRPDRSRAAFTDAGFVTGDVGEISHGKLRVLGRRDDMVQVRGTNVSLIAVETELLSARQHSDIVHITADITEVAVVAIPDPVEGRKIIAVIVADTELTEADFAHLRDLVRRRGGSAAVPRVFRQVPQLPMLANGKIDRLAVHNIVG